MKYCIGDSAELSRTISDTEIILFSGITGDTNGIHINKKLAEESVWGRRVAHGILVTGLISAVLGTKLPGEGTVYLEQDARFLRPVYSGDTVTARVTIEEIINSSKGIIKLNTVVFKQDDEKVIEGYAVVKVPV